MIFLSHLQLQGLEATRAPQRIRSTAPNAAAAADTLTVASKRAAISKGQCQKLSLACLHIPNEGTWSGGWVKK